MFSKHKSIKRGRDEDTDTDSDNEMFINNEKNWPKFLLVESTNDDLPLQNLSLFAIQKGFQAVARTPKCIKRLRDGSFLVEAQNLLQTKRFVDRPVRVSVHKTLNSSRGVIRCRDLADMSEVEIRDELKDQGVVGVNRVTLNKEGKEILTHTPFLTFGSPELQKEITVGYIKVKVALFVHNPMHCFNCNKSGYTSQRCKVAAKCPGCGKDKHEGRCERPKLCSNCNGPHASSAKDCPVWQKEKEIQRVRVEKRISFPEARQLVEAKMPTVVFGGRSYAAATSTTKEMKTVECQTSLTFFFFFFFLASAQDSSIFSAFLWRARIGICRHSGFLREVEVGIGRRSGSLRSREKFRDSYGFSRSLQNGLKWYGGSLQNRP